LFGHLRSLAKQTLTKKFEDGLTYAGVGWAIWRNKSFLPDEILFTVNYLGSPQVSFTLNFSKSAVHVIGQYYQLLRLGKSGFRSIVSLFVFFSGSIEYLFKNQMKNLTSTSDWLAKQISDIVDSSGKVKFELLGDNLEGKGLPLVAWHLMEKEDYDGTLLHANLYTDR
jgi:glutamate decarboxylase